MQPAIWASLLGIYTASCGNIDVVEMAYVMRDGAISFLPEISKQFRNSYVIAGRSDSKSCPKISFPLVKLTKSELWASLPRRIRYFIHFCEYGDRACGRCSSCKRFKDEVMDVHDFMLIRDKAVAAYDKGRKAKIDEIKAEVTDAGNDEEMQIELPPLSEREFTVERNDSGSNDPSIQG